MNITSGKQVKAQRVVIYGPEKIGKTWLSTQFPKVLVADADHGSHEFDVARTESPTSYPHLLSMIDELNIAGVEYKTFVIDTIDAVERLMIADICAKKNKSGIEDFGYGKGFTYLQEEMGRFLNKLTDLRDKGWNIVLVSHSILRKFEQPEESGAYDRYELNLSRKTAVLVKEWADMLLFLNYKIIVTEIDGRKKASGGKKVMYTSHTPSWDAGCRCDLPDELPLDYDSIRHVIEQEKAVVKESFTTAETVRVVEGPYPEKEATVTSFPSQLWDLMTLHGVTDDEIKAVVVAKGYYPPETHPGDYDDAFVQGVLIGAWDKVYELIKQNKNKKEGKTK